MKSKISFQNTLHDIYQHFLVRYNKSNDHLI